MISLYIMLGGDTDEDGQNSANSPGVVLDVNFVIGSRMSFTASDVPLVRAVVALKGAFVSSTVVSVIQPDIINMPRMSPPQYLPMMVPPAVINY